MNVIKYLFVVCCASFILSSLGVNASTNHYTFNLTVPSFNGSVRTPYKTKHYYSSQKITNGYTTPTYDDVDVKLKYYEGSTAKDASGWKIFETGVDLEFSEALAIFPQTDYYLYFDSRINYTKDTQVAGIWIID